jgi:hypothetical protein
VHHPLNTTTHNDVIIRPIRVWFNKCFSSVEGVLLQLRADWPEGLYLIGSHTDMRFTPFACCDLYEKEPSGISPEAYVDWCIQFCTKHKVDVFIPGRMRDVVADHRAAFTRIGTQLIVAADGDTLRLLEDKGRFLSQVPEGVSVHGFYRVNTWKEFVIAAQAIKSSGRNVCFKPAKGTFGIGFYIIDDNLSPQKRLLGGVSRRISTEELQTILDNGSAFSELLVMEYLDGSEFSVDALAHDGEILAMVCRRKPFHGKLRVQGTSEMRSINDGYCQILASEPKIEEMMRKLTKHFHLCGIFNAQFRSPALLPEKPHLLEINGRMSGGLPYVGLSGLNLTLWAIRIALRKSDEPMPEIPIPQLPLKVQERSEILIHKEKV